MTSQSAFTAAILDPEQAVPAGLVNPDGRPATKRFDVYRNNVAVSLTDALQTGFPVIRKLVGDAFFDALAGVYLRQFPPSSPLMMHYGEKMPVFLRDFPPVAQLPYLSDVARLELGLRTAYHAADATPLAPAALQNLSAQDLMGAHLTLAPAVQLIASPYPIHGIWLANTDPNAPKPQGGAQTVMISRPEFDPQVDLLSPPAVDFIVALMRGKTFGEAMQKASATDAAFDLTPTLGLLLSRNALTALSERPKP